jgi:hypothetical protein
VAHSGSHHAHHDLVVRRPVQGDLLDGERFAGLAYDGGGSGARQGCLLMSGHIFDLLAIRIPDC